MNLQSRQRGYALLFLLILLAVLCVGMSAAGISWSNDEKRFREQELLYVGEQYQKAFVAYHSQLGHYPPTLSALLTVAGTPPKRFIRRIYADPITGVMEWGAIKAPDGGIAGVYSLAPGVPFKQTGFSTLQKNFEGAEQYSDWKFIVP